MRPSDLTTITADTWRAASARISDMLTPTLRVGVTGLARSGKTVFITALVRNLVAGGRLPYFSPMAQRRIVRAYLEPHPDDHVARFPYEEHLAQLARDPPQWPESTTRVSQLRLTVEHVSSSTLRRTLWPGRLHIDIVDYPGEWLLDLPLLQFDFSEWSGRALADAQRTNRLKVAKPWLDFVSRLNPSAPAEDQVALEGAALFTRYLQEARVPDPALAAPGPGRFLLPGDAQGSPLLTFFPLPSQRDGYPHGSLGALLTRRFNSYKTHIVKPFFRDHFARLDRQIVLMDLLTAVNSGAEAIADLQRTLEGVLECFKPGERTWLSWILTRRIDRLLFAATKADHLHHTSHDRLEALLGLLAQKAITRAQFAGAEVKVMALAALRATRETEARTGWQRLPCVIGVPLPGERLGRRTFDGTAEAVIFPGDLPADPGALTSGSEPYSVEFPRFRPPRLSLLAGDDSSIWPHIRLDRALEFLLGDHLV